jgi:hypothetical protein
MMTMNMTHTYFCTSALLLALTLASVFDLSAAPGNMVGNQSQNEGILVLPAPEKVVIDGELGDWDLSGRIWVFSDKGVRDRYSVKISAMWDQDNLYLAARWNDPTPMTSNVDPSFNPENGWRSDAWQMRFLTDRKSHLTTWYFTEKKLPVMHISHHRKGFGGEILQARDGKTLGRGIELAYKRVDEQSFTQEIKLPWRELYKTAPEIKAGLVFRLGNELLWGDVTGGKNHPTHRYADNMQAGVTRREFYWTNDKAWGNATLVAKGGVEKRRYFSEGSQPKGVIPVEVKVPVSAKRFTVAINDAKGNRIRNLAADSDPTEFEVGEESGQRTLRILWDGLDDEGVLVPQGNYTITGLTHEGLDARYEMSYYNPGTPVWNTADGSGGWGGDHPDPIRVAMAGDMTILSWPHAEGGSGLIGLNPEGRRVWGERRGAKWLAADENYLYAVGKDHLKHLLTINRMRVKDGGYAPFVLDGKARAFDLHLKDILGSEDEVADFAAIARYQNTLILAFADGTVAVLDAATAVPRKRLAVPGIIALAAKGDRLYGATETAVFAVDVKDGKTTPIPVAGVGKITDLAIDNSGNILVADMGPDKQVKAFTTAGKPAYTCGVKGGRPIRGTYNAQAMLRVSSIDVDHSGRVWAVERWANPRRVSVWSAKTGTLVKDYVGNTGYSARSTWMSDDPDFAYAGPVKMRLDRKAKTYSVTEILWVPDREKNEGFSLWSGQHWYACPKFFDITVKGQTKRLLYLNGVYGRYHAIYAKRNTCWQPVATITSVKQLKLEIPKLNLSEHADEDGVIWNDFNKDAAVSLDECTFVEGGLPAGGHWGTTPAEDGSLYLNSRRGESYRYRPVRFADDGAPIYGTEGLKKLAGKLQPDIVPLLGDKMVLNLGGHPKKGGWLQATSVDGSKTFWRYPNPYPGVHGSHNAPMPQPGTLIGPLNIIGTATVNETIGKVLMIRGNLGSDYLVTVKDGLLIGSLFGDLRLPMPALPKNEAELYGKGVKHYTNGGEPFNGWFGSQKDGKIRMLNGMAGQAAMIYEMEGLETIERLPATPLPVSAALLAKAELDNQARATKALKKASSHIHRVVSTPSFDGKLTAWKGIKHNKVVVKGNPSTGLARLAYSGTHLYAHFDIKDTTPWLNRGKEWDKLFKTGDAVDIQLRTKASESPKVVDGDLRIVVAPFQGKPVAVLMRPLDGAAPANLKKAYNSPVTTKVFDRVEILKDAQIHVTTREDGYSVEIGVPLAAIGLTLKPGDTLAGDLGFIVSDKTGTFNIARVYWSDKHANLVNDLPHESWLAPRAWGTLVVK